MLESIRIIAVRFDVLDDKKNGALLNNVCQLSGSGSDSRAILGFMIFRIPIGSKTGFIRGGDDVSV